MVTVYELVEKTRAQLSRKSYVPSGLCFGASNPPEITAFNPYSTVRSASIASFFGTMMKTPDVGFGVVGTNT